MIGVDMAQKIVVALILPVAELIQIIPLSLSASIWKEEPISGTVHRRQNTLPYVQIE